MPDSKTSLGIEATVTLREVTQETVNSILNLRVTKEQEQFVASNAVSIAEAHFSADAWFRAIYADETPVGFLMLSDQPDKGEYFLWRFMVDAQYLGPLFIGSMVETVLEVPKVSTVSSFSLLFIGRTMALISPTRTKGLQHISPTKSKKMLK